jgi:putative ABC transport system ATP-binding protein
MNESPNGKAVIRVEKLSKSFVTSAGRTTVLTDISLEVRPGELLAVVGKSGSGKTTLLNMITGIDKPTSGSVTIAGRAVTEMSEREMAAWRGKTVGIVFQFFQLLPTLSVIENVLLPMDFCGIIKSRERQDRAMALLKRFGVAEHARKLPSSLSGGEQQRVAIARAMANDPPILAADEPTGNLDSRTAASVLEAFSGLAREGKTVFLISHEKDLGEIGARVVGIEDGRLREAINV